MTVSNPHDFPSMDVSQNLQKSSLLPKMKADVDDARKFTESPNLSSTKILISDIQIAIQRRYQKIVLLANDNASSIRTFILEPKERMLLVLLTSTNPDSPRSLSVPLEESELGLIRDLEHQLPLPPEKPARTWIGWALRKLRSFFRWFADLNIPASLRDRRYVNTLKEDFPVYKKRNAERVSIGLSHDAESMDLLREFLHERGIDDREAFDYLAQELAYLPYLA